MYKNEANCETGEIKLVALTAEEIAEREALAAEIAARPPYEQSIENKLASVGLSLDDLKVALGV